MLPAGGFKGEIKDSARTFQLQNLKTDMLYFLQNIIPKQMSHDEKQQDPYNTILNHTGGPL